MNKFLALFLLRSPYSARYFPFNSQSNLYAAVAVEGREVSMGKKAKFNWRERVEGLKLHPSERVSAKERKFDERPFRVAMSPLPSFVRVLRAALARVD